MAFLKKFFIIISTFYVVTCGGLSTVSATPPEWYQRQTISSQAYEIIGYGQGETLKTARANAQQDIAGQLSSEVRSEFKSKEVLIGSDDYHAERLASLTVSSHAVLTDLETVITSESAGRYFVALRYNFLPLEQRAEVVLGQSLCRPKPLPRILQSSDFAKRLSSTLGCPIYFEINKTGNVLRLYAGGKSITLRPGEFNNFLSAFESAAISIRTPDRVLREGDTYFLAITAHKKGFLSLFSVDEQGQVFRLIANRPVDVSQRVVFPDPELYEGLEALVIDGLGEGRDLFVAVLAPDKANIGSYLEISERLGHGGYEFDRFVNQIDEFEFSAIAVRVIKKAR